MNENKYVSFSINAEWRNPIYHEMLLKSFVLFPSNMKFFANNGNPFKPEVKLALEVHWNIFKSMDYKSDAMQLNIPGTIYVLEVKKISEIREVLAFICK